MRVAVIDDILATKASYLRHLIFKKFIKKRYDFHRLREHYFAHANAKSPARKAETFEELRTVVMQMYQDLDSPKFAVGESHIYDIFDPRTTRYYSDAELAEPNLPRSPSPASHSSQRCLSLRR